jgi:serine protease Do
MNKNFIMLIASCIFFISCQQVDSDSAIVNSKSLNVSQENAITKAIQIASPAIVAIYADQINSTFERVGWFYKEDLVKERTRGSGFLINADGYVLTNAHNFITSTTKGYGNIKVVLTGGKIYNAEVVGYDITSDIALLKIPGSNFDFCYIGDSNDLIIGEWVIAMGNPLNLSSKNDFQPIASAGIVSATGVNLGFQNKVNLNNRIQTDAAINPGNSGGPLLNSNGQVIGINSFVLDNNQNLGFAIPINYAIKIAENLKISASNNDFGFIDRSWDTGLSLRDVNINGQKNVIIDYVNYDSSAFNENFYRGDKILQVQDYKIYSIEDFKNVFDIYDFLPGESLSLLIERQDEIIQLELIIGKYEK